MVIPGVLGPPGLVLRRQGSPDQRVAFEVKGGDRLTLGPDPQRGELSLLGRDPFGLHVTETLRFDASDYRVEVVVRLENGHSQSQSVEAVLGWVSPLPEKWPKDQAEQFQGQRPTRAVWQGPKGVRREELGRLGGWLADPKAHESELNKLLESVRGGRWIGLESEWYLAAVVAQSPGVEIVPPRGENGAVQIALRMAAPPLAPGQTWEGRALLYVGPKEHDRLSALGVGLEGAIFWGGFPFSEDWPLPALPMAWVGVPILWLMNFIYRHIGNYGVAIIILTLVTKILFYPLTLKSMASMKAMQALQPQVNALRAKHQKDPQRLQRETMELYRKHGANPMGGCLPMVVQIPVFYALYVTLSVSVELQNAAFVCFGKVFGMALWICDLAQQDPTYVLPVLMGASMFVQQKMTPTVGDPRQAKIMLMLPVVFTFMFLSLPSGLVLYWFVSNVLQILQQYYMEKRAKAARAQEGVGAHDGGRRDRTHS
jgi:YidC/Oxa1 family membrane protein insertase